MLPAVLVVHTKALNDNIGASYVESSFAQVLASPDVACEYSAVSRCSSPPGGASVP